MDFRARIEITLKPSIFDPAGAAIESSLRQLGHHQVAHVRLGKIISLTLSAPEAEAAHQQVIQMCEQLLANPVIERYAIEITERQTEDPIEASQPTQHQASGSLEAMPG
jgi:phosphoribosylformylglycinamidine synthase PurS subunit